MNKQNLGKSQFILTFGPGSIIESVNGPRLIPSLKNEERGEPVVIFGRKTTKKYTTIEIK